MSVRVDYRSGLSLVGTVLKYLSIPVLLPIAVALAYGEPVLPFVATIAVTLSAGTALERLTPDPDLGAREGFLMVGVIWLAVALVGAVPYLVAAHGLPYLMEPIAADSTLGSPANAVFESMSGFTTTGATVLGEIDPEKHTYALLIWRQLTQWLGGMGIVVLAVAILPRLSVGGAQLIDAEAPGPGIEKLTPRIAETARALWVAYLGFTAVEIVLLYGLHLGGMAPNMTPYNAVAHGLTTMPTGGFSPEARSIEAFSAAAQWVIIPFMTAAGVNFALFWRALTGDTGRLFEDTEFRAYVGAMAVLTAIVAALLFTGGGLAAEVPADETYDEEYLSDARAEIVGELEPSLRYAAFQVVSLTNSTGYANLDFNAWGTAAQYVLLFGMLIGGSAGSTGGGIKVVRWVVILKAVRRELYTTAHPDAVRPVRLGGRTIDERAIRGIYAFTLLYLVMLFVATLLIYLDAARVGLDLAFVEALTAALATLGNIGPGFGLVGPMGSYLAFSDPSKLFMVALMWLGRLEILPVLVLLTPEYWNR